jgi:hypothetical protein
MYLPFLTISLLVRCTCYWLLLLGGVERSVLSTATILWPIMHPHLSYNTPDSYTSALWLHQRHLAVTQGGGEKCPWTLLTQYLHHATRGFFTCGKILTWDLHALLPIRRKVCCGFLSPLKGNRLGRVWTRVLWVQWQSLTTTPPRRLSNIYVTSNLPVKNDGKI